MKRRPVKPSRPPTPKPLSARKKAARQRILNQVLARGEGRKLVEDFVALAGRAGRVAAFYIRALPAADRLKLVLFLRSALDAVEKIDP